MTNFTVSDIFTRVQRTFGDEAAVQVTLDDVLNWINDSQKEACNQIPKLLPKVAYLDTVQDQIRYDFPSDLFTLSEVYYQDSNLLSYFQLKFFTLFEFSQWADGWDGTTYASAQPAIYTREANELIVFPAPRESAEDGLKLHYARYPVLVTADTDPIDLPEYLDQYLLDFCMNRAYEMDEDWSSADRMANRIQTALNDNKTTPEQRHNQSTYASMNTAWEDTYDAL